MRTITGKTIYQAIQDGDIKVGTELQVDRDVTCQWHRRTRIESIRRCNNTTYDVCHTANNDTCNCEAAQQATGLTITIFDEEPVTSTTPTTMQKLTSALKRFLDKDVQTLYKAGYLNGELALTSEGKEVLSSLLLQEKKAEMVIAAEEEIAEAEKK